ncbi:Transmembrane protein 97 [Mortierella sp. GBA30]|nr:Transmembrane protein 97 [Mortierella sp. GBA30]
MATRVSLSARPKDLVMFIYFASHIPATILMDLVPLYPSFLEPFIQPLIEFQQYYIETYRDPFMATRNQIWFETFLHMEGLVQLPIFFYAAWLLYHNKRSAALWICVYASHVITTVLPCLMTLNFNEPGQFPFEITDSQKTFLTCLYLPWLIVPMWMLYECFQRVRSYENGPAPVNSVKKQQ